MLIAVCVCICITLSTYFMYSVHMICVSSILLSCTESKRLLNSMFICDYIIQLNSCPNFPFRIMFMTTVDLSIVG